jgi:anti-sigma factor RsiW
MTDCPNVEMRDHLPDLANDSLESAVRLRVEAHLETCAACEAEIAIIRSTRLMMRQTTPRVNVASIVLALPSYADVAQRDQGTAVREAGVTPITAARSMRGRRWGSWRAAAAITMLAAGLGSYAVLRPDSPVRTLDSTSIATTAATGGMALTGALADLSDSELTALVQDIEAMDALPSTEVDIPTVVAVPTILPDSIGRELENF